MPKQKTKKSAAKRFKVTGTGKILRGRAYKSHLTGKKTSKRKRHLRNPAIVSKSDKNRVKKLLPYEF